jgi:hypothetical protein
MRLQRYVLTAALFLSAVAGFTRSAQADPDPGAPTSPEALTPRVRLPIIMRPGGCPAASANSYAQGPVYQWDLDNPVRPAYNHADKNLGLRGYTPTSAPQNLVSLGSDDPTQPPQFATLFSPNRVPAFSTVYRANNWNWAPSPNPGSPGTPITDWPVTVLGLQTTAGEALHTPASGYDLGQGVRAVVMFADADTVALHYTREDSASRGYTVHVDNLCTDPNLLSLYNALEGARNVYRTPRDGTLDYNLVALSAGQVFGTARGSEIRVAIVDSGAFMDPRSCHEWWQVRPGRTC